MSEILEPQVKVSDQTEALGLYLEALFREQPETDLEEKKVDVVTEVPSAEIDQKKDQESDQKVDQDLDQKLDQKPDQKIKPELIDDGRPEWARESFQTLFVDIDGMSIALPMTAMSGIKTYPDQLNQIPNSVSWIDGSFQSRGKNIQVVNTRKLFLLSSNREIDPKEEVKKPEFIVQIGDGRWGLACHSADHAVMLEPDQVRWSGAERRRPWLLGMVKEHLCALLDGDELIKYLDDGAKPLE